MNPISINSTTGSTTQFGFEAIFDLFNSILTIDVSNLTVGTYTDISFSVLDGYGNEINSNIPLTGSVVSMEIPLPSGDHKYANYVIVGILTDTDAKTYSIEVEREICKPSGSDADIVPSAFTHKADCKNPLLTINDNTAYAYDSQKPISKTKNFAIRLPNQDLETIKNITATPIQITEMYSGDYLIKGYVDAKFDLEDGIYVIVRYGVNYSFNVTCDDRICEVVCCVEQLQSDIADCNGSQAKLSSLKAKRDEVYPLMFQALSLASCGKSNADKVSKIKEILDCECGGCGGNSIEGEPSLISTQNNYSFSADCFEVTEVGGVVNIACKGNTAYDVVPLDAGCGELITITPQVSGTTKTYKIGVDCDAFKAYLTTLLSSDTDILNIINEQFNSSGQLISVDNADCLDVASQGDYHADIWELDNKYTFTAIKVYNIIHHVPTPIVTSDYVAIASYLNSLGLGIFTVQPIYNSDPNIDGNVVRIESIGNANDLNHVEYNQGTTSSFTSPFYKKSRIVLSDLIQALVNKICELCFTDIKTCKEYSVCSIKCEYRYSVDIDIASSNSVYAYVNGGSVPIKITELDGYNSITAGNPTEIGINCGLVIDSIEEITSTTTPVTFSRGVNGTGGFDFTLKNIAVIPIGSTLETVMDLLLVNNCSIIDWLMDKTTYANSSTLTINYDPATRVVSGDVIIDGVLDGIMADADLLAKLRSFVTTGVSGVKVQVDSNSFVHSYTECDGTCANQFKREVFINGNRMAYVGCTGASETIDITGGVFAESYGSMNLTEGQTYSFMFKGTDGDCTPTISCVGVFAVSFYDATGVQVGSTTNVDVSSETPPNDCYLINNIEVPAGAVNVQISIT